MPRLSVQIGSRDYPHQGGASLLEIILSLSLLSILMLAVSQIMTRGYAYYWESLGTLDVQQSTLTLNRRISDDLYYSNQSSVELSVAGDALIFASPKDEQGYTRYTHDGNLNWVSFICYYPAEVDGHSVVIRKRAPRTAPNPNPIKASDDGKDLDWFKALPGGSVVGKDIAVLEFTQKADSVDIRLVGSKKQRGVFELRIENTVFPRN